MRAFWAVVVLLVAGALGISWFQSMQAKGRRSEAMEAMEAIRQRDVAALTPGREGAGAGPREATPGTSGPEEGPTEGSPEAVSQEPAAAAPVAESAERSAEAQPTPPPAQAVETAVLAEEATGEVAAGEASTPGTQEPAGDGRGATGAEKEDEPSASDAGAIAAPAAAVTPAEAGSPAGSPAGLPAGLPAAGSPAGAAAPGAEVKPEQGAIPAKIETQGDGSLKVDGRFVVKGEGTAEKPYEVTWDQLVSVSELYNPRDGKKRLPERVTMFDGKFVRLKGYVAFPLYVDRPRELLSMLNQWDGCCIGVPPTPFDAVEVKLRTPIEGGDRYATTGEVTGKFGVKPYLAGDWLVGLYVMDDAVFTTKSTAGATKN